MKKANPPCCAGQPGRIVPASPGHVAAPQIVARQCGAPYFPVTPVDLAIKVVSNHADAAYTNLLLVGLGITLVMGVVLLVGALRKNG